MIKYPKMIWSSHAGWDELARDHPTMNSMFVRLVLPLSLLPPLMIVYASGGIGARYFPSVGTEVWWLAATLFFALELLTVPLMTWVIHSLAVAKGGTEDMSAAFTIASIAPAPLWLSALVLLQNQIWLVIAVPVLALVASAALIHNGVERLLGVAEDLDAAEIANTVIAVGVVVWMALLGTAMTPLLFGL